MLTTKIGITGTVLLLFNCWSSVFIEGTACSVITRNEYLKKSHSTVPQPEDIITQAMSWKSLRLRQFTSQLFIVFMITINKKKVIDASFLLFFACHDLVTSKPTHMTSISKVVGPHYGSFYFKGMLRNGHLTIYLDTKNCKSVLFKSLLY